MCINSLTPGRCGCNLKLIIFISRINIMTISCYTLPSGEYHKTSTLVQVMAWCYLATTHYLNQYWSSMIPYTITKPQRVNILTYKEVSAVLCDMGSSWNRQQRFTGISGCDDTIMVPKVRLEYSRRTRSLSWLLMSWLLLDVPSQCSSIIDNANIFLFQENNSA